MYRATCFMIVTGLLFLSLRARSQKLAFSFDAAGNQTGRAWVCVGCTNPLATAPGHNPLTLNMELLDNDKKVAVERKIIASPNPLVETLTVDWQTEKGISVKNIKVFAINGIKTHEVSPRLQQNNVVLPFQRLATGTYIVYVTFSDNRKESIKVIKQ